MPSLKESGKRLDKGEGEGMERKKREKIKKRKTQTEGRGGAGEKAGPAQPRDPGLAGGRRARSRGFEGPRARAKRLSSGSARPRWNR